MEVKYIDQSFSNYWHILGPDTYIFRRRIADWSIARMNPEVTSHRLFLDISVSPKIKRERKHITLIRLSYSNSYYHYTCSNNIKHVLFLVFFYHHNHLTLLVSEILLPIQFSERLLNKSAFQFLVLSVPDEGCCKKE
jgi:hypothetical protein